MNYYNIPEDEHFIIDGLFAAMKNDAENGIKNMTNALIKGFGTFHIIMVAFKRREFRDNVPLEFLYEKYVETMETKGFKIPALAEIKAARTYGISTYNPEYFKDYLKTLENELAEAYALITDNKKKELKMENKTHSEMIDEVHNKVVGALKGLFSGDIHVGLKSIETGIKKGETAYDLVERALKRRVNHPVILELKKTLDETYDKVAEEAIATFTSIGAEPVTEPVEIEQETDTVDDTVPFISPNLLLFDKEVVRAMLNDRMLEIAQNVYDVVSWDEYNRVDFNDAAQFLKKKERKYLKGQAEMLRWTIELVDVRVENIGHKMLSHMVANW